MSANIRSARFASIVVLALLQLLSASVGQAQVPTVTLTDASKTLREPGFDVQIGTPSFIITRSVVNNTSLTVNYTIGGTATNGSDYATLSGTITIGPGLGGVSLPIKVLNDDLTERDETLTITLSTSSNYSLGAIKTGTVTIIDIDQKFRLTNIDATASEPGQDNATVRIERLGTLSNAVTLDLAYIGTATLGADFTAPTSVSFAIGDSLKEITIVPVGDATAEGNETIIAKLPNLLGQTITLVDAVATVAVIPSSVIETQGNTANFVITRTGNLSQSLTVPFVVSGTATNGVDYNTIGSSVVIPAGAATASVPIVVKADAGQENGETVILTLGVGPTHGAGVPNSATLLIQDNVAPIVATLALGAASVMGGSSTSGTVTLNGPAPSGGIVVNLTSSSTSATLQPAPLTIPAGQSSGTFSIATTPRSSDLITTITAAAPTGAAQTQSFTIQAGVFATASLNRSTVTPQALTDSTSVVGTVTITGPAPTSGTSIQLSSSSAAVVVPASVVIGSNQTSATFKVKANALTAATPVTITATRGAITKTMNLTVNAPTVASLTFAPASLAGGFSASNSTTSTLALDGVAPSGGLSVSLSDNSDRLTPRQTSLFFSPASTSGTVIFDAQSVATPTPVTVTGSIGTTSRTGTVTIVPPAVETISFSSPSVVGGQVAHATLTLNGNAPVANYTIPVSVNSAAAFPCTTSGSPISSVSFGNNAVTNNLSICTQAITGSPVTVTLTAGQGASAATGTFQISNQPPPATVASVVLTSGDVIAGADLTGTVTMSSTNGGTVTLTSNNAAVKLSPNGLAGTFNTTTTLGTGSGQSSVGFFVSTAPVGKDTVVTISATPGTISQSLMVRASVLTNLFVNPASVPGGTSASGRVKVSGPAPQGGFAVQLSSNNPAVTVPSVVTIFSNSVQSDFTVATTAVQTDATATITATLAAVQVTKPLTVTGPLAVASLSVAPASVPAGSPATLLVTLSATAPAGGTTVPITCSSPNVTAPTSVVVPEGQTSATATINTQVFGAASNAVVPISAALGGSTKTAQLTVEALQISSMSLNTSGTITGGVGTVIGTVHLNRAAPASGIPVTLASDQAAISVPSTLTIPGGQNSATFQMTTTPVAVNTLTVISATFGQSIKTMQVTVSPPSLSALTINVGTVTSGGSITATVGLAGPAGPAGVPVTLTSNNPAFASIPATVTVPAGQQNAAVQINIAADAPSGTFTLTGNAGASTRIANVTVQSLAVATLTLNPTSIRGGGTGGIVNGTIALPSPPVIQFSLPISGSNVAGVTPSSVVFNLGQTTATFAISTTAVTSNTVGTITAGSGPGAKSASLTVTP